MPVKAGRSAGLGRVLLPGLAELPVLALPGTMGRLHARPKDRSSVGVSLELAWGGCYESTGSHPTENPALCWGLPVNQGMDIVFGS